MQAFRLPGLNLKVSTPGARLWRFKYRLDGWEKLLALGQYPDFPLARARQKKDEPLRLVADGVDPAVQRLVDRDAEADTAAVIAAEWLAVHRKRFAPAMMEKAEWTIRDLVNLYIGNRPIAEIMPLELLNVFRRLASTCLNELGWHRDLTELQLAHAEHNEVRAVYNRTQRLPERRTMMQAWGDYLIACASGAN